MDLVKLLIIFAVLLIALMLFKKPLWIAAVFANLTALIVYWIPPLRAGKLVFEALISSSTIEILAVMYLVSFLQVMMQAKGAIDNAEKAMVRLFNSHRSIIVLSPIFMGLLPAPNAVLLSAPIVDSAAGDSLSKGEKTFLTSYYRHIPESALPLYPGLLVALGVTGLSPALFMLGVIPLAAISIIFPYFTTVRKVPKAAGLTPSENKKKDLSDLLLALWPIILLIVIVLFCGFSTSLVTLAVCTVLYIFYRFPVRRLWKMLGESFHFPIMVGMAFILILKDIIASTDVILTLPERFSALPIPLYMVYALVIFVGGLTGLSNVIMAVMFPVVFSTIPGAGIPLLLLLMGFSHSAAQISPTHICLEVAVGYFKSDYKTLVLKTLPVTIVYCVSAVLYYLILTAIF